MFLLFTIQQPFKILSTLVITFILLPEVATTINCPLKKLEGSALHSRRHPQNTEKQGDGDVVQAAVRPNAREFLKTI